MFFTKTPVDLKNSFIFENLREQNDNINTVKETTV